MLSALGLLAVGPIAAGFSSTVVMSDSMAPGIRAGDVVVVRPVPADVVRPGKVVLADDPDLPGRLRLHRVVATAPDGFVLQGDANPQPDSAHVSAAAVHGIGFLRVPAIGLPVLWLRTGQPGLAVLAFAGVAAAALAVVVLDPNGSSPGGGLRRRRVPAAAAVAAAVLLAGSWPSGGAGATAWAAFSGRTTTPNTFQTGTWACPATPSPAPEIAYSFMAASGVAEANRGSQSGYGATLSSASLRVTGTCSGTAGNVSPSLRFTGSGSEALVGSSPLPMGAQGSQSVWFLPAAASGVVTSLHATSDASAAGADRQLYFTSDGHIAYAMRSGASVVTCAVAATVATDVWHFAAVVFSTATKTFTLYLDGTASSCSATVATPSTSAGVSRIGSDTTIAADASTAAYRGGLDEVDAWSAALSTDQIAAVRALGH